MSTKSFAFLFAFCIINVSIFFDENFDWIYPRIKIFAIRSVQVSVAFRTLREVVTETEPTSEEAGVFLTNFLHKAWDKTVPKYRIDAVNKIIMDMMTSKTSAEGDVSGVSIVELYLHSQKTIFILLVFQMKFLKLFIECTLVEKDIPFTSDQYKALDEVLTTVTNYSGEDSNEISEKDLTFIRGELLKVLPADVTKIVTDTLSVMKKDVSSAEKIQGTVKKIEFFFSD